MPTDFRSFLVNRTPASTSVTNLFFQISILIIVLSFPGVLTTDVTYAGQPVIFPIMTSTGHATISQTFTVTTGLDTPGDVYLSSGSSVGVLLGSSGLPFAQQTPNMASFLAQYYPQCLTNRQMSLATAIGQFPQLNSTIAAIIDGIAAQVPDITSSNSWNFPFGCYNFSYTGADDCKGVNFGIQSGSSEDCALQYCTSCLWGSVAASLRANICSSSPCATLVTSVCDCSLSTWPSDYADCVQYNYIPPQNVPIGPSQQYLYGVPAVSRTTISGFYGGDINWLPPTMADFLGDPSTVALDWIVFPDILSCMVDPQIASDGVLPPGPPVPLDTICQATADFLSLSSVPPSYVLNTPISPVVPPQLPSFCARWATYEYPTGPTGVVERFYPTSGFWLTRESDLPPTFFSFNYTLNTGSLDLTDLQGGSFVPGQSLSASTSQISVMGSKSVTLPGSGVALYLPQDEGYLLYAVDLSGASRRRRGCYCALLCFGIGGCGGGDVSGLNRLKDQVVELENNVASFEFGVGTFETGTAAYIKSMAQQNVAFMDATNGRFDMVWAGISDLGGEIDSIKSTLMEFEGLAQHYADAAYLDVRGVTLTLAQFKQQVGFKLGQLLINVAVMRESIALSSLRAMQAGSQSASMNYCETLNPLPFDLSYSGTITPPTLPSCIGSSCSLAGWGFGTNPSTSTITAFPTLIAGSTCFLSVIDDNSFSVTWRVPTFDSTAIALVGSGSVGPAYPSQNGRPLYSSVGLPFFFRNLSLVKPVHSDRYFAVSLGICGLTGPRSSAHLYVDVDTGELFETLDPIHNYLENSVGHPYLYNVTGSQELSVSVVRLDLGGISQPATYPLPGLNYNGDGAVPVPTAFSYPIRGVSLDYSNIISGNVTCPAPGIIDYSTYPPQVHMSAVILPDTVRSLTPGTIAGSFATFIGLPSLHQTPPWSIDLIDSYLAGQGMGGAALLSEAMAVALEARLSGSVSALSLSDALISLASSTNQSLAAAGAQALQNAGALSSLQAQVSTANLAIEAMASRASAAEGVGSSLSASLSAIAATHAAVTAALSSVNSNLTAILNQIASNEGAASQVYVSLALNSSAAAVAASNQAAALAIATARDTFPEKSSACSGFSDIGCMLATFVQYMLMIVVICAVAAGVIWIAKRAYSASKTRQTKPESADDHL